MKKLASFSIIFLIFIVSTASAQTLARISIEHLTLGFQRNGNDGEFSMRAVNTADQTEKIYAGRGSFSLPLFNCLPCNLPNSFSSNGFQRFLNGQQGFAFNWEFDKQVYFYVSQIASDTIILRPTIRRKPRAFSLNGTTEIRGRVEIRDMNGIVAADDNVTLKGNFTARFINNNFLDGRKVEFTQIEYVLNRTSN